MQQRRLERNRRNWGYVAYASNGVMCHGDLHASGGRYTKAWVVDVDPSQLNMDLTNRAE